MTVKISSPAEAIAACPDSIGVFPYTMWTPEGAVEVPDISTPTKAVCLGAVAFSAALRSEVGLPTPNIGLAGEVSSGWRTGDGMNRALRDYGFDGGVVMLSDANSTPPQALELTKWFDDIGCRSAVAVVADSHESRVRSTFEAGKPETDIHIVTARDLLRLPAARDIAGEEADHLSGVVDEFARRNGRYELVPRMVTAGAARLGVSLDRMAEVFDRKTEKEGPNHVTVTGTGTEDDPYTYRQWRGNFALPNTGRAIV